MDIDTLERITALGKTIGLEGKDLQDFLRDERAALREKQAREYERERDEREREHERDERERIRQYELEMARIKSEESVRNSSHSDSSAGHTRVKAIKLPQFDDSKDSINAYLTHFEKYQVVMRVDKEDWAIHRAALLKGKALEV